MRKFIEDRMNCIFADFKEELTEMGYFCELKNVVYKSGNIPDYSKAIIQQLYLLRYFPAYFTEYYLIYLKLLRMKYLALPLNVLSIGAGSGIDYFGLVYALKKLGCAEFVWKNVKYTGVDKIEWNYQSSFGHENCWFLPQDITSWGALDWDDYNVIMFPKSIGEFDKNSFNRLMHVINNTDFTSRKICLISSVRSKNKEWDTENLKRIVRIFEKQHNYKCRDSSSNIVRFKEDKGLRYYIHGFIYPQHILDYMKNLVGKCDGFLENNSRPCSPKCPTLLNRHPILRTKHINFQLLRLER